MVKWIEEFDELYEFLSLVLLCSPDKFPRRDFLRDDEQLNLERAFDILREGMKYAADRIPDEAEMAKLREGIEAAYSAYRAGSNKQGTGLLVQVQAGLGKHRRRPR